MAVNIPPTLPELYLGKRGPKIVRDDIVKFLNRYGHPDSYNDVMIKELKGVVKSLNKTVSKFRSGSIEKEKGDHARQLIGSHYYSTMFFYKDFYNTIKFINSNEYNDVFYLVGKDFFEALTSVRSGVPLEFVPNFFEGYIAFPNQKVIKSSLSGLPVKEVHLVFEKKLDKKDFIEIVIGGLATTNVGSKREFNKFIRKTPNWLRKTYPETITSFKNLEIGGWEGFPFNFVIHIDKKTNKVKVKSEQSMQRSAFKEYYESGDEAAAVIRAQIDDADVPLANALLAFVVYISSGKPDISFLAPALQKKEPGALLGGMPGVEFSKDIGMKYQLVSWRWKKKVQFSEEMWFRRGHYRLQKCGPGMTEVKLIYIEPTTARRSKELISGEEEVIRGKKKKNPTYDVSIKALSIIDVMIGRIEFAFDSLAIDILTYENIKTGRLKGNVGLLKSQIKKKFIEFDRYFKNLNAFLKGNPKEAGLYERMLSSPGVVIPVYDRITGEKGEFVMKRNRKSFNEYKDELEGAFELFKAFEKNNPTWSEYRAY